jgi:hypothetical protein
MKENNDPAASVVVLSRSIFWFDQLKKQLKETYGIEAHHCQMIKHFKEINDRVRPEFVILDASEIEGAIDFYPFLRESKGSAKVIYCDQKKPMLDVKFLRKIESTAFNIEEIVKHFSWEKIETEA